MSDLALDRRYQLANHLSEDDDDEKSLSDYLQAIKRRKGLLIWSILGIFTAAVILALKLPAVYVSSATILIEQQEIPEEFVRSLITSYADQRIQLISQRVMTTTNLSTIIDKYNLYEEERKKYSKEKVLKEMRSDIKLDMLSADVYDPRSGQAKKATIAFTLSYQSKSPALAQNVTNEIVSLYLNENLKSRTQSAAETSTFLNTETEKLSQTVLVLEAKLADFKKKNVGKLPENTQINMQLRADVERDLLETERSIRSLEERKVYLQAELAQQSPYNIMRTETGESILSPADRLKVLRTSYFGLSAKYGDKHPDVVRLMREIDALEKETNSGVGAEIESRLKALRTELIRAKQRYSESHPDVKRLTNMIQNLEQELTKSQSRKVVKKNDTDPDNPAYIQLQAQLEAVSGDLSALKSKIPELRQKLASYEEKLIAAPGVEQVFRQLTREYETALAKYQEVTAKQMEANFAKSMETEQKGEKLILIEPPLFPEEPAKPNRPAIMFLGAVLSFAGGIGGIAIKESLDGAVYGRNAVTKILGSPPLAVIPLIHTEIEQKKTHVRRWLILFAFILLIACALLFFHIFVKPLDVFWYSLMNKFGI